MSKATQIENALSRLDGAFIKALTEPARLEILKFLALHGPSDAQGVADVMTQDRSVVSRHLALMKDAGILRARKEGRHVYYRIDGEQTLAKAEQIVASIRKCLEVGCC